MDRDHDLSDRPDARQHLMVLAAFAVGQAIHVNNGVIHPAAIAWLAMATICMTATILPHVAAGFRLLARVPLSALIVSCVTIQLAELIVDACTHAETAVMIVCLLLAGAGIAIAFWLPQRKWLAWACIVIGHCSAGALTIASMPRPGIDVWYFQNESTAALLHGADPYSVRFRDIYGAESGFYSPGMAVNGWLTYSYPYPPVMLWMTAPGKLAGDVRWAHLAALELAATLFVLAAPTPLSVLSGALLLLMPRSLFVIQAGWTEPMVLLLVAATAFCAAKRSRWMWVAFGLLLGIKQYTFILTPLLLVVMPWRDAAKVACKGAALALLVSLPLMVMNPVSFVRSVILWQIRQPFRPDALSLPALLDHVYGIRPGMWLCLLAAGLVTAVCCKQSVRNAGGFVVSLALVLLVFFVTSKQAFCNYYFLVAGTMAGAVAMSATANKAAQETATDQERISMRLAA